MKIRFSLLTTLLLLAQLSPAFSEEHHHAAPGVSQAKASIQATQNQSAQGWLKFAFEAQRVHIWGEFSGLSAGKHGLHIHQYGDCSALDGSSAGGHFSADTQQSHAGPQDKHRHSGDLGNLEADANGKAVFDGYFEGLTLEGLTGILGRGVIVHATADDFKTQPAGAAGARIACGVIGLSAN